MEPSLTNSSNDWTVKKIAWLFQSISSGSTPPSSNRNYYYPEDVAWLNTGDLNDGYVRRSKKFISNEAVFNFSTLQLYPENSLVMAMYGATIGKLGITEFETTTNQACCVLANPLGVYQKYMFYWLLGHREQIIQMSQGGGQPNISQGIIKSIRLRVPPLILQKRIALFLDRKYEGINELIVKKEKLISLLNEKHKSVITEAVTKGLSTDVKMKDSGVEWIGKTPDLWKVQSLKWNLIVCNGREIEVELEHDDQNSVNVYGSGGVFKKTNAALFTGESVLVGRKGTIGKPLYVNDKFWTVDTMYYTKFYKDAFPKFFYYLLLVFPWEQITTHTALPSIVGADLANSKCAIPPYEEQKKIVQKLDIETTKIHENIKLIKIQIHKLKEYRQSLIYEAVIGEIDVREMVAEK